MHNHGRAWQEASWLPGGPWKQTAPYWSISRKRQDTVGGGLLLQERTTVGRTEQGPYGQRCPPSLIKANELGWHTGWRYILQLLAKVYSLWLGESVVPLPPCLLRLMNRGRRGLAQAQRMFHLLAKVACVAEISGCSRKSHKASQKSVFACMCIEMSVTWNDPVEVTIFYFLQGNNYSEKRDLITTESKKHHT